MILDDDEKDVKPLHSIQYITLDITERGVSFIDMMRPFQMQYNILMNNNSMLWNSRTIEGNLTTISYEETN